MLRKVHLSGRTKMGRRDETRLTIRGITDMMGFRGGFQVKWLRAQLQSTRVIPVKVESRGKPLSR